MRLTFSSVDDAASARKPGPAWSKHFRLRADAFEAWYFRAPGRPDHAACSRAIEDYMPELFGIWQGASEFAVSLKQARMLSLWCPPPFAAGCSQMACIGEEPALIRNYDHSVSLCEATVMHTNWLRPVIASVDCLWGALDGINNAGLAVSLAYGGRPVNGEGFGVPLILRYVLETCTNAAEATAALIRIPCSASYSVTVVDEMMEARTVYLNPDRAPVVVKDTYVTNHQGEVESPEHDVLTSSSARLAALQTMSPELSNRDVVARFLRAPLLARHPEAGVATIYTAAYFPASRRAEYHWPSASWTLNFDNFTEQSISLPLK